MGPAGFLLQVTLKHHRVVAKLPPNQVLFQAVESLRMRTHWPVSHQRHLVEEGHLAALEQEYSPQREERPVFPPCSPLGAYFQLMLDNECWGAAGEGTPGPFPHSWSPVPSVEVRASSHSVRCLPDF